MTDPIDLYPCLLVPFEERLSPELDLHEVVGRWIDQHIPEPLREALLAREHALLLEEVSAEVYRSLAKHLMGLPPTGVEELAVSDCAVGAVAVRVPVDPHDYGITTALELAAARAVASAVDGVVVDLARHCIHPLDARDEAVRELTPGDLIKVVSSGCPDHGVWVSTVGMNTLGLLDLELCDCPPPVVPLLAPLLQRIAEVLLARVVDDDGHLPTVFEVDGVRFGLKESRDVPTLLTVCAAGSDPDAGPPLQALAQAMGLGEGDKVIWTPPDDEELEAATRESRAELAAVRKRFVAGLEPMERLFVRARFRSADGGSESMMVCVDRFTRHLVRGRLANRPIRLTLRQGQQVKVPVDDVMDWVIERPDGTCEGDRVGRILGRRLEA